MTSRRFMIAACLTLAAAAVEDAAAQSYQPHSLQASLFGTTIRLSGVTARGLGGEGQYRYNRLLIASRGVASLGLGGQYTTHSFSESTFRVAGGFLEPRFVFALGSERFYPYLALRMAMLRQSSEIIEASTGWAAGGGAGIAYVLNRRTNLDIGFALVRQSFSDARVIESNQPYVFPSFTGYAAKVGLSFGL